jgi:hypothetical protein
LSLPPFDAGTPIYLMTTNQQLAAFDQDARYLRQSWIQIVAGGPVARPELTALSQ